MLTTVTCQGEQFQIDAAILMAYSTVARNMVKYSREDDGFLNLNLNSLEFESLREVFNWLQNANYNLTQEPRDKTKMMDLWVTSDYLMIEELSSEIENWFVSQMSLKKVVEIYNFAKRHFAFSLHKKCQQFLMENFHMMRPRDLRDIDLFDLVEILQSDDLTQCEKEIGDFVHGILEKSNIFPHLEESMRESLRSCQRDWRAPYLPRSSKELVFSFGGWTDDPVAKISVYDPSCRLWRDLDVDLPFNWSYMGAWLNGSTVYLCGGYTHGESDTGTISKKLFGLDLNTMELKPLSKMRVKRNYVCVEGSPGFGMMAVGGNSGGGFNGNGRLESAECYDIATNQWREIASMTHRRSDAGIATVGQRIYVVGGFNGSSVYSSVEVFTEGRRWKKIRPMSTPRSGVKAVGMDGKLYVVGGWNGNERLRSGEVYNPIKGTWKPLPDMIVPRSNFSLVVVNDQLLAFGGYDGHSVTSRAEILNLTTNTWEEVGPLPSPRSALTGVTVPRKILDPTFVKTIKSKFDLDDLSLEIEDMDIDIGIVD